jgi:5'(3')-deoxyribonucleotidase
MKKVILVDMDGVLVKEPSKEHEYEKRRKMTRKGRKDSDPSPDEHQIHWSDVPEIFLDLEPMEGAIDAFNKLSQDYELYVVSTAPWNNSSAWSDKKRWIEKYLPIATKRLILTHHKNMIIGDYLIDDRLKNGVDNFQGKVIHFGQHPFENWSKVLDYFDKQLY